MPERAAIGLNRSKGAKGPAEWRPPDEDYWCRYATDWTEVKMEWGLTMTQTETEAVIDMLDTCEEPVEVEVERAKDLAGTETSGQTTRRLSHVASSQSFVLLGDHPPSRGILRWRLVFVGSDGRWPCSRGD